MKQVSFLAIFLCWVSLLHAQGVVVTYAGTDWTFDNEGKQGTEVSLGNPTGVAVDSKGNVYVADSFLNAVLKMDTSGEVTVVAGNGLKRSAGDGGPARAALLEDPQDVAVDDQGNIYIAEYLGSVIRKVSIDGTISTVGRVAFPNALAVDHKGNLYVKSRSTLTLMKITPSGVTTAFVDPAVRSFFRGGMAVDKQDNLYTTDIFDREILKIDPGGGITSIAKLPDGLGGYVSVGIDNESIFYVGVAYPGRIYRLETDGSLTLLAGNTTDGFSGDGGLALQASFSAPRHFVVDRNGSFVVADTSNQRVRRFSLGGAVFTVLGNGHSLSGETSAQTARFALPTDLVSDTQGNLYVSDQGNQRIRRIAADGITSTVAGSGRIYDSSTFSGLAVNASIGISSGLAIDPQGAVVIGTGADLLRADPITGQIKALTHVTSAGYTFPYYDAAGNLYANHSGKMEKITTGGVITQLTGSAVTGTGQSLADGVLARNVLLGAYWPVIADTFGTIYFAEHDTWRIWKVDSTGVLRVVAGTGSRGYAPDGSVARNSPIAPFGRLLFDRDGNLLFNENGTQIRGIRPNGTLFTVAGTGQFGFQGDGGLASAAAFQRPDGLALDPSGDLYVVDTENNRIRKIISGPVPVITLSQKGLTFTSGPGSNPVPLSITLGNGGLGTLNFLVVVNTQTGGDWLKATPVNGSVVAGSVSAPIQISVDTSKLASGTYYGLVTVIAPGVPNSPQTVTVVLNVASSTNLPLDVTLNPGGIIFTTTQGGASPAAQKITLSTLNPQSLSYNATPRFGTSLQWFSLANPAGTVAAGKPVIFSIAPVSAGLAQGVYGASLSVATGNAPTKTADLYLIVAPPKVNSLARAVAGCTPQQIVPVISSLSGGFTVSAGWPIPIETRVVDDCGEPMTAGSVVASFSNGDLPVVLDHIENGIWTGNWKATHDTGNATITVTAKPTGSTLQGIARITGTLTANDDSPPIIAPGGVLSAAGPRLGAPVSPGGIISIYGTNLASAPGGATAFPLPTELAGTRVLMAGRALPLLFVSDSQINAQVPYDLPINTQHGVIVSRGNTLSVTEPVSLLSSVPGVFQQGFTNFGVVVIAKPNGARVLATSSNPATAGDALEIYCTGLGDVAPRVIAGTATPVNPFSHPVDPVTVTIGGQSATVLFEGLTPQFAGLYQIDVVVPAGIPSGTASLIISQGTNFSPAVDVPIR
ncbi:MAG: hypothetical protein ABI824_16925 [Acidobacteriota bacterium]